MSIINKIIGPKSKYDKTIPYTYEAKINVLSGLDKKPVYRSYFSDTICGLIEQLDTNNIKVEDVQLFGVYLDKEIELDIKYCANPSGRWLKPPALCKSLENQYKLTMHEIYKGHTNEEVCSFDDRDKKAF